MPATTCLRSNPLRKMREGNLDPFLTWTGVANHLNSLACFDRSDNSPARTERRNGLACVVHADFADVRRDRIEGLQLLRVRPLQGKLELQEKRIVVDAVGDVGGCVHE